MFLGPLWASSSLLLRPVSDLNFFSTEIKAHAPGNRRIQKFIPRTNRRDELAVIDVTDPAHNRVVAIPQALLEKGGDIQPPGLPFALRVKNYFANSLPALASMSGTETA